MTELSELVGEIPNRTTTLGSSGDSIQSEPIPITSKTIERPNGNLSDSETGNSHSPQNRYSLSPQNRDRDDLVTNLEFLADSSAHLTVSSQHNHQDNTDLEDLLDEDDLGDLGELLSDSNERSCDSHLKLCDDDYDAIGKSSSEGGTSSDEEEEILALKAKHEKDMLALLARQEVELRTAEQDLAQKKLEKQRNSRVESDDFAEETLALKNYYDRHAKGG
eukprot:CAMPEP_0117014124 /NCGR_PEP_ID=MMETSP0472-20121206/11519_1 /TAXON_ID=693140 ORGANISM="Tiarina fusus, Strain LIS" /NCGR_SAMPLE_ID=MMETSP0472 /ASSEMBLY_ACC=CAM_ASM_000603 /LENGTH=219 /DNA_ID=CAMNT_0004717609 /DNA_START=182 /DNA_END=837 /DNA_ORIENTATION=+